MRVLPMGERAALVEDPPGGPAAWAAGLRTLATDGVVEVVPGARTVLVACRDAAALAAAMMSLDEVVPTIAERGDSTVEISVVYDGPDLAHVAAATGLRRAEVVARHQGASYTVAFCGFAPGFAYLAGLPPELHLPRRTTPRTRVPAGSVAIASEYSAVYPRSSPGGWHLLGTTTASLFDAGRDPPALLAPGTSVRFVGS